MPGEEGEERESHEDGLAHDRFYPEIYAGIRAHCASIAAFSSAAHPSALRHVPRFASLSPSRCAMSSVVVALRIRGKNCASFHAAQSCRPFLLRGSIRSDGRSNHALRSGSGSCVLSIASVGCAGAASERFGASCAAGWPLALPAAPGLAVEALPDEYGGVTG